jgi:NADPH-dependent curcumin reductase CurA
LSFADTAIEKRLDFSLSSRPVGIPDAGNFSLDEVDIPPLSDDEFLVQN